MNSSIRIHRPLTRISHKSSSRGAGIADSAKARAEIAAGLGEDTLTKAISSATQAGAARASRSRRLCENCGLVLAGLAAIVSLSSCGRKDTGTTVKINGSDTMLQVGLAWQEAYKKVKPDVIIDMNGEGSGIGLKALINGEIDLAYSSRSIKESEIEQIKEKYGKDPQEIIFGYDRIAVYVHKDNPVNEISMAQLKGIFAEGGEINDWSQLDPSLSGAIELCSRSNTSGTYVFFKDAVCGEGVEFKKGATSMTGSAAVVDFVRVTPNAIGYSGMGYKTPDVKWLTVTQDGKGSDPAGDDYPIARSLYGYTAGEPQGAVKEYVDWCKSDAGQAILESEKFVPLPPAQRTN